MLCMVMVDSHSRQVEKETAVSSTRGDSTKGHSRQTASYSILMAIITKDKLCKL